MWATGGDLTRDFAVGEESTNTFRACASSTDLLNIGLTCHVLGKVIGVFHNVAIGSTI